MIRGVFDILFGCWHNNYSFPITVKAGDRRVPAAEATGTYVVCLDCGKEFSYDWKAMQVVDGERFLKEQEVVAEDTATVFARKQAA